MAIFNSYVILNYQMDSSLRCFEIKTSAVRVAATRISQWPKFKLGKSCSSWNLEHSGHVQLNLVDHIPFNSN